MSLSGGPNDYPSLRVTVTDRSDQKHHFQAAGLYEDYTFTVNDYTGELTVERVTYGPRGTDEWARTAATVIAAWPFGAWASVTRHSGEH